MNNMIEGQIRPNGVNNSDLISTITKIDRLSFMPKEYAVVAYADSPIFFDKNENTRNRFTLSPLSISKMIQALDVKGDDIILDMYCNCGYSTALLAYLAKRVIGYEPNDDLCSIASENLNKLEIYNASVESDDSKIKNSNQKFDKIIINGATREIPSWLFEIINENGIMVAPSPIVGNMSAVNIYKKQNNKIEKIRAFDIIVPEIKL